jgi:hypothetical protein
VRQGWVGCIALLSGGIRRDELLGAGAAAGYDGPADLLASLPDSILGRRGWLGTERDTVTR